FYDLLAGDFGLAKSMTKPDRLRMLLGFLIESRAEGRRTVLFVDEAHRLSIETLEEIRLLTNFETETEKLLHIVLAGQDELDELLDRRELRQLKQRVEVRLHIGPLSAEEVPTYINHRWSYAGGSEPPFSGEAVRRIGQDSCGIPRLINTICDNALMLGFAETAMIVTEKHIAEVSRDLRLNGAAARRPIQTIEEKPAAKMELKVPPPVLNGHHSHPLSILGGQRAIIGDHRAKQSRWPRLFGLGKA